MDRELLSLQGRAWSNSEDIHTAKLGLALSAFGTIIWGWGQVSRVVELQLPRCLGGDCGS